MTDRELFETRVVPVMDRVRGELERMQADEARRFMRSPAYILSGGTGPDGGMGAQAVSLDSLSLTGEWNSKTVEDYVGMVKDELEKENITVTREMEEMMIDKMARDRMPGSSIDYVLRKAGGNIFFGLPVEARKTDLQREVEKRSEALHNPTKVEKGIGLAIGAAADFATLGGLNGGIAGGLRFVGADLAVNAIAGTVESIHDRDVPKVILPGHEKEWREMNARKKETTEPFKEEVHSPVPATKEEDEFKENVKEKQDGEAREKKEDKESKPSPEQKQEDMQEPLQSEPRQAQQKSNTGGWQGILTGLGLDGLSDIGRNAGYILAMLPDILVGMFTGRTTSLGVKDNLVPIASIMAGLFVRNPLLKMTLIGLGGANLINKAGHEELARREGSLRENPVRTRYLQYDDQQMDPRIRDAQVHGRTLIATIDGIPVTIALPEKVADAYAQGVLPLGTLANAVLDRCDQMQELSQARDRFEQESRETGRVLSQR